VILPTKGIPPRQALVSLGAEILRQLTETKTVSRLWHDFGQNSEVSGGVTFDWFILGLDLLFLFGAVEFERGKVRRVVLPNRGEGTP